MHHPPSSEVTRKPVPDISSELTTTPGSGINLNIDIRCIDSSVTYLDIFIFRNAKLFAGWDTEIEERVYTYLSKIIYIRLFLAIFASLAGDVLCRILGVVG